MYADEWDFLVKNTAVPSIRGNTAAMTTCIVYTANHASEHTHRHRSPFASMVLEMLSIFRHQRFMHIYSIQFETIHSEFDFIRL